MQDTPVPQETPDERMFITVPELRELLMVAGLPRVMVEEMILVAYHEFSVAKQEFLEQEWGL